MRFPVCDNVNIQTSTCKSRSSSSLDITGDVVLLYLLGTTVFCDITVREGLFMRWSRCLSLTMQEVQRDCSLAASKVSNACALFLPARSSQPSLTLTSRHNVR